MCIYCVMRMHIAYVCLPVAPVFRAPTSSVNVGRWRWHAGLLKLLAMMTDERGAGLPEADNGRGNWEPLLSTVLEWLVRQMAPWPCVFRCIRLGVTGKSVACGTARHVAKGGGGGGGRPPPPLEARRALFGARSAPKRAEETARSAVFREFRGP